MLMEILVEKGYAYILGGCSIALVVLLILRSFVPKIKSVTVDHYVTKKKVALEEELEIGLRINAVKKVEIKELAFYVECLTRAPDEEGQMNRRSFFFIRKAALKNVVIYPNCMMEEKMVLQIPLKGSGGFLPGTFERGNYSIAWRVGYIVDFKDIAERLEKSEALIVYPVSTSGD